MEKEFKTIFTEIFGLDKDKEELLSFCKVCESPDCREVSFGDDGLTVCPDCNSTEQGYIYLTEKEAEERGLI